MGFWSVQNSTTLDGLEWSKCVCRRMHLPVNKKYLLRAKRSTYVSSIDLTHTGVSGHRWEINLVMPAIGDFWNCWNKSVCKRCDTAFIRVYDWRIMRRRVVLQLTVSDVQSQLTTWPAMDRLLRLLVSVKESKWAEHGGGTDDDGLVERLSRRYTSTLLAAFAMMVTTKQFVGEPISCWCPTFFTDSQRQYTNNVCWISNTFYVPLPVRLT